MGGLRMGEILLILAVVLLLFGATRLPQLGASLGQAIRNFKRGFSGGEEAGEDEKKGAGMMTSGNAPQQQSDSERARAHSKVS